jgi:RNA polymerase sigma factor (sigma-70 family)
MYLRLAMSEELETSVPKKDYVVQIKVKNGPLLRAIRAAGYSTVAAFARTAGVDQMLVGKFLNFRATPVDKVTGRWKSTFLKVATALRMLPEDLVPPQHLTEALKKNTSEAELSAEEIFAIMQPRETDPEKILDREEKVRLFERAYSELPSRQQEILARRYALFGGDVESQKSVARDLGVSDTFISDSETRAITALAKKVRRISGENYPWYFPEAPRKRTER